MTKTNDSKVLANLPDFRNGLHVFTDGCFEPRSGEGGWAFVVDRNGVPITSGCGGVRNTANNAMEIMAVLQAALWLGDHAAPEPAVIWSDSLYAVRGCNSLLPIWKSNGWKKLDPNPKARRRPIPDIDLWKAIDLHLFRKPWLTVKWCKGHDGIDGNERADALAEQGRQSLGNASRRG